MAREMTGSGTNIEVIAAWTLLGGEGVAGGAVDAEQATMSPAAASWMSSISSACMRTRRPTLWACAVRALTIVSPRRSVPGRRGRR
jgi:hypothetical protein